MLSKKDNYKFDNQDNDEYFNTLVLVVGVLALIVAGIGIYLNR